MNNKIRQAVKEASTKYVEDMVLLAIIRASVLEVIVDELIK